MRPIANKNLRRAVHLTALNAVDAAIGGPKEISWDQFLAQNPKVGAELRTGLWAVGHMKCWFSEATLQQGEGHIEHYRPKRGVAGTKHPGYKWRTFDWNNLRLAHATVNLRRTDYLTKRKMGKGSYFPLQDESKRASNAAGEAGESPALLDPIIASDTLLICFDEASGAPTPRFSRKGNRWPYQRADQSIDYYHLDEGTWNAKRADLMAIVRKLCEQLEEIAANEPINEIDYNNRIDEIVAYINPFAEFSSACLQVVRERGLLEHFATGLD